MGRTGNPAATVSGTRGWRRFEHDLAGALSVLAQDHTVVVSASGNRYVQFAKDVWGLRSEAVSDEFLEERMQPPAAMGDALVALGWSRPNPAPGGSPNFHRDDPDPIPARAVARRAVRSLVEVYGVALAAELEYRAFQWRSGEEILLPSLRIRRAEPRPRPVPTRDDVRRWVRAALREASGNARLEYDAKGNLSVRFRGATVLVRVREEPLRVEVCSPIARLALDDALLRRLNELNQDARFVRFLWMRGFVFASAEVRADPFVARHFLHACAAVGEAADDLDGVLEAELGRTLLGSARAGSMKN